MKFNFNVELNIKVCISILLTKMMQQVFGVICFNHKTSFPMLCAELYSRIEIVEIVKHESCRDGSFRSDQLYLSSKDIQTIMDVKDNIMCGSKIFSGW